MAEKKNRERVMAEITLSHLLRLANEQGCPVSREQALAFLNQKGRAYEMWMQMMQAGEDFLKCSLLHQGNNRPPTDSELIAAPQGGGYSRVFPVSAKSLSSTSAPTSGATSGSLIVPVI